MDEPWQRPAGRATRQEPPKPPLPAGHAWNTNTHDVWCGRHRRGPCSPPLPPKTAPCACLSARRAPEPLSPRIYHTPHTPPSAAAVFPGLPRLRPRPSHSSSIRPSLPAFAGVARACRAVSLRARCPPSAYARQPPANSGRFLPTHIPAARVTCAVASGGRQGVGLHSGSMQGGERTRRPSL